MAFRVTGSVSVGLWAKIAGAWTRKATRTQFIDQGTPGGGQQTVNWLYSGAVDLGPNIQAFGVTVESHTGTSAAVTDLASVSWTATTTSGERSATPSGQTTTAVVTPN